MKVKLGMPQGGSHSRPTSHLPRLLKENLSCFTVTFPFFVNATFRSKLSEKWILISFIACMRTQLQGKCFPPPVVMGRYFRTSFFQLHLLIQLFVIFWGGGINRSAMGKTRCHEWHGATIENGIYMTPVIPIFCSIQRHQAHQAVSCTISISRFQLYTNKWRKSNCKTW